MALGCTVLLTSSGSPTRALANLVGTMPGATPLTRIPLGPSSEARPLVRPSRAVLLTAYIPMGHGGLRGAEEYKAGLWEVVA